MSYEPDFLPDQTVRYRDWQNRPQTGRIVRVTTTWETGPACPRTLYTIEHPTYRDRRFHASRTHIFGLTEPAHE